MTKPLMFRVAPDMFGGDRAGFTCPFCLTGAQFIKQTRYVNDEHIVRGTNSIQGVVQCCTWWHLSCFSLPYGPVLRRRPVPSVYFVDNE